MKAPTSLPLEATVTMVVEDFASRSAHVVVKTEDGDRIEQEVPLRGARARFRIGSPALIEVATFDSMAIGAPIE